MLLLVTFQPPAVPQHATKAYVCKCCPPPVNVTDAISVTVDIHIKDRTELRMGFIFRQTHEDSTAPGSTVTNMTNAAIPTSNDENCCWLLKNVRAMLVNGLMSPKAMAA